MIYKASYRFTKILRVCKPKNSQYGLSKYEFAIVLVIFGILAALLLDRLIALEHETERLEVSLTIRHIHVGLKLAIGEKIMRGQEADIAALLDRNPLEFLGEAQKVGAGGTAAWRYDPARRVLHYRPRQPAAFAGREELRWQYGGRRDELGRMVGLGLEPLP